MTFVGTRDVLTDADMTGNKLSRPEPHQRAKVGSDIHPSRVFEGRVHSLSGAFSFGLADPTVCFRR